MDDLIRSLEALGWFHDRTSPETVRLRLRRGDDFVTIGPRTTHFYHLTPKGRQFFGRFETRNVEGILVLAK